MYFFSLYFRRYVLIPKIFECFVQAKLFVFHNMFEGHQIYKELKSQFEKSFISSLQPIFVSQMVCF